MNLLFSLHQPQRFSRRRLFTKAAAYALGAAAGSRAFRDVSLIGRAMASGSSEDYKALVCIFLGGGNDSNNMVVPADSASAYYSTRGSLALPATGLSALGVADYLSNDLGLHPSCAALDPTKLAVVLNVGTLAAPETTKSNYATDGYKVPQLFSHNDQVIQWQAAMTEFYNTGWGGRVADIVNAENSSPVIPMSVSLAGGNLFETGSVVAQYHVSPDGVVSLSGSEDTVRLRALRGLLDTSLSGNLQRNAFAETVESAIQKGSDLNAVLDDYPADTAWTFPDSSLGEQLSMIARLISARSALSLKRQIFYCTLGGFDTHAEQFDDDGVTSGNHADLLADLASSMAAFQTAMEGLGVDDKVTTFTSSDFSRTLEPNGSSGSDHGWGGHQLVMGGAVVPGGYGQLPSYTTGSDDYLTYGRVVPSMATEQYFATLAKWFGVSDTQLFTVFENLSAFTGAGATDVTGLSVRNGFSYGVNLGFMG